MYKPRKRKIYSVESYSQIRKKNKVLSKKRKDLNIYFMIIL